MREQVICVLSHGFVIAGEIEDETDDGNVFIIRNAWCIERYGTTKGLGELREGPTSETRRNRLGMVQVERTGRIFTIRGVHGWE